MSWDEHYATEAGARYWPSEELVRFLSGKQFEAALDVGAGTGSNLRLLQQHAPWKVVAVEPNARAREHLGKFTRGDTYGPGVTILDGEAGDLMECFGEEFDLVVDVQTSQHISWSEHPATYGEYWRVLEPGGMLWLYHADAGMDAETMREPPWDWSRVSLFPSIDLFCLPSAEALEEVLRAAGFDVVERRGLVRTYPDGRVASYTIVVGRKP